MKIGEYATAMAAYNAWMNEKLYAAAAELTDEERKRDLGAAFGSIHGTFNHLMLTDRAWMQRFRGEKPTPAAANHELYGDFEELRSARSALDGEIREWARGDLDGFAESPFHFYSFIYQREGVIPGWAAIAHFFNHQTHHRGQATTLLAQLGKDAGVTDMPWMPYFTKDGPA